MFREELPPFQAMFALSKALLQHGESACSYKGESNVDCASDLSCP